MAKDVRTYKQYKELGYDKLHKELKRMLAQESRLVVWAKGAARLDILPALLAMRDLTAQPGRRIPDPNLPTFKLELESLGMNYEQFKKWTQRTAAETSILDLIGGKPQHRDPRAAAAAKDKQALKILERLTKAVLDGNDVEAEQVAAAAAEYFQFS